MKMQYIVIAAIGVAAVAVGSFFSMYQLYQLVQMDAECRGLKHPKLWGAFSLAGNNSSGLIFYLLGRRRYPIVSLPEEQKKLKDRRKKKLGVSLVFQAAGAIVLVLSLFLSGQF